MAQGISLACVSALTWFNYQSSHRHSVLLAGVILLLLYALVTTGVLPVPSGSNIPLFTLWPRISDAMKAVPLFALIFLWTPIAMQITPGSYVGVGVILVPDAIFLIAALVFLSNGLSRSLK